MRTHQAVGFAASQVRDTLPRGCYAGVCHWTGDDGGGVAREIFAYTVPQTTGIVLIDDMSHPDDVAQINSRYTSRFESGDYFLMFVAEPENLIPTEWRERARTNGELPNFFSVPWTKGYKILDKVVDLRLPQVQEWFFEEFSDPKRLNIGWSLPEMTSFHEMLPLLQGQSRGGNPMTLAIGRELRLMRVGGLVFPSARCDTAVVQEHGKIVDWYGWNLVDYSQRESDGFAMAVMNNPELVRNGWEFFGVPFGRVRVKLSSAGLRRGTWQVVGIEALNRTEWIGKLTSAQRQMLGLPGDEDLLADSEEGLHEVERQFRRKFRDLKAEHPDLPLTARRTHALLAKLGAKISMTPFYRLGSDIAISREKLGELINVDEQELEIFTTTAIRLGFLVELPKGYFQFASEVILDYFEAQGAH